MGTEHWLALGLIIATILLAMATVLGPSLAIVVQNRLAQQQGQRVPVEPFLKRTFRKARVWLLDWIPWILMSLSVLALYLEVTSQDPIDRGTIFAISVYIAVIAANVTLLIVDRSINKLLDVIMKIVNIFEKHVDTTAFLKDAIFTPRDDEPKKALPKPNVKGEKSKS